MDSSPDEALPVVYFIQTRLYPNEFFFDTSNELERGGQGWRRVGLKPRLPIGERKREGKNSQLQVGEFTESVFRDKRGEGWNELFHRQLRETDN